MSAVLGIDYSTKAVDLVFLDENEDSARWHSIPLERGFDGIRKIRHAYAWQRELEDVYLVVLEDPMSAGRTAAKQLGRVSGAIGTCLPVETVCWLLRPDEWRMACGLPGNGSKAQVASWAASRFDCEMWSQDALDALAMAWAGREMIRRAVESAA